MSHAMPPIRRTIKNVVHNFSDSQIKVREATSNDPWGPSSTLMAEIADLTYNVVAFSEIMQMIWKRLNDHGKNWRHVYKALTLLDYLIKTGSEKVAQQCKENIFAIQTLKDFMYVEENKDQGINVREKAKQLVALLKDDERLKNERSRALKAKERFAQSQGGFSSKDVDRVGGGSGGNTPTLQSASEFPGGAVFGSGGAAASGAGGSLGNVSGAGSGGGGGAERPHRQRTQSEIESARPQTAGEEELQLQLALAISKEEADDEEKKKRADALRLDMAIAESKHGDEEPGAVAGASPAAPSGASQLLDISLGGGAAAAVNDPWSTVAPAATKKEEDWLSGVTSTASSSDPWGLPPPASAAPPAPAAAVPILPARDPWGSPTPAAPSPSRKATSRTTSPWGEPMPAARSISPAAAAITVNGKSSPWDSSYASAAAISSSSDLFDLSGLEPALNEKSSTTPSHQTALSGGSACGSPLHGSNKPKRSPEDFLGANSALVNLDALVAGAKKAENAAAAAAAAQDNNPFAMSGGIAPASLLSSSTAATTNNNNSTAACNPFLTPSAKGLPLNQMKAQTAWGDMGGAPMTPPAASSPFSAPAALVTQAPPPFMGSTPLVPFASSSGVPGAAPGKSSPFAGAGNQADSAFGSAANNDGGGNPFLL